MGSKFRQLVPKYVIDLFDKRVLQMPEEAIRCIHWKGWDAPFTAILSHLLGNENYVRMYSSECFLTIERAETSLRLYVNEAWLINNVHLKNAEGSL